MELKRYKDFVLESKTNLWIYDGDFQVKEYMVLNGKFIKDKIPDVINGDFYCSGVNLESLEGGPEEVGGFFNCSNNKLTSLEGCPVKVGRHFNCYGNNITSLFGVPTKIKGFFNCSFNELIDLKYSPKKIEGDFRCIYNKIKNLKASSVIVNGDFNCSYNELTNLKGSPKKVKELFNCSSNKLLTSLEGISKNIGFVDNGGSNLIEKIFINSGSYKNNYWKDLLEYMIDKKIDLQEVHGWPKNFLTDETIKSVKGISKFNL